MESDKGTKICGTCKIEFPKNDEFFFKRTIRQKNKHGITVEYQSFKSDCKSCHGAKGCKRYIKNRCKEMECLIEDYMTNWKKQIIKAKTKYPEIMHLPPGVRNTLRRWMDNGYIFTTYEQYQLDCKKSIHKGHLKNRRYDYKNKGTLSNKDKNDMAHKMMPKSRVAMVLGIPSSDLPNSLYESIKTNLQIKRELGLTHSTIKERNVNNKYQDQWKQKEI